VVKARGRKGMKNYPLQCASKSRRGRKKPQNDGKMGGGGQPRGRDHEVPSTLQSFLPDLKGLSGQNNNQEEEKNQKEC